MTPYEVGLLTPVEFRTMMSVWSNYRKNEAELKRNVVLNAIYNSNRKKNQKLIPLFEKEVVEKSEDEILKEREELFSENPFVR